MSERVVAIIPALNAERTLPRVVEEARRQLKEHESRLEAFRRANPGQMPAQFEANQQALQTGCRSAAACRAAAAGR